MRARNNDHPGSEHPYTQTWQQSEIDLRALGIDLEQAAELRARLMPFAGDWDSPEMDIYDNYDAAKSKD